MVQTNSGRGSNPLFLAKSSTKSGNLTGEIATIANGKMKQINKEDFMTRKWSLLKLETQKGFEVLMIDSTTIHLCDKLMNSEKQNA